MDRMEPIEFARNLRQRSTSYESLLWQFLIGNDATRSFVASTRWVSTRRIFTASKRSSISKSMDLRITPAKESETTKPATCGCAHEGLRC